VKLAEKATKIRAILDEIYPAAPIPLRHRDPFTLLVAVLLSAQTTDARVNLVTPALFARADTPEKMAKLRLAEIHDLIRTCGLAPAKAKALAGLSKILLEKHGGRVPRTFEELEALPGVGHKTASVVMAQAFGIPAFPVDTHIHRLAQRWGLSDGSSVERTERDLKRIFPEDVWIRLHLQIILFGREHCPALRHDTSRCPICSWAAKAGSAARPRAAVRPPRADPAASRTRAPASRARGTSAPGSPATSPGAPSRRGRGAAARSAADRTPAAPPPGPRRTRTATLPASARASRRRIPDRDRARTS
jgi:endonuclease-3